MQSCVQRFRSRRRLGDRAIYFNEYLFLGGIDTSPQPFGGLDPAELKEMTPAQRRDAAATDVVHGVSGADERFYDGNDEHWTVDFAGVTAGFFSVSLVLMTGFQPQKLEAAIGVVENFLRYVLQHEVCPEYSDNVNAALGLCRQAKIEWPMLNAFECGLPGCFNLAAAELFCPLEKHDWSFRSFRVPDGFDARTTFLSACALCDEAGTLTAVKEGKVHVSGNFTCTVEIVKLEAPSETLASRFAGLNIEAYGNAIEPLGKVYLELAAIEDGTYQPPKPAAFIDTNFWIYLEEELIACLLPKMKMEITVTTLNTGIRFIKSMAKIVPSFYTFLPQQLMKHYVQPRKSDRPAPSARDRDNEVMECDED